jgi:hypothetical protein
MFDPEFNTHLDLARLFKLHRTEKRDIPQTLEPELKYRLKEIGQFQTVFSGLLRAEQEGKLVVFREIHAQKFPLVSMGLETVNKGYPTFRLEDNGLMLRMRFNFHSRDLRINRMDISAKERLTNLLHMPTSPHNRHAVRKEWETSPSDVKSAYTTFLKARHDHPLPPVFHKIKPEQLMVEEVLMTNRLSYHTCIRVPGSDAIVIFEHCHDSCLSATPDCITVTGKRTELEAEIKHIQVRRGSFEKEPELIALIQDAMKYMDGILRDTGTALTESTESKLEDAAECVNRHYAGSDFAQAFAARAHRHSFPIERRLGRALALLQNLSPQVVARKFVPLRVLSEMLPTSKDMAPGELPVFRPGQFVLAA